MFPLSNGNAHQQDFYGARTQYYIMSTNSDMSLCSVCNKSKDITTLHYCLCDKAVCEECVNTLKTNKNHYKCPQCGTEQDLESTKLFRIHSD